jgi:ribokinase
VRLVIVGHLALNEDRTPAGTKVSNGGSAYYCGVGASVLPPRRTGIVAPVGDDYDHSPLRRLGVDQRGVKVVPGGETPRFVIIQHADGSRSFEAKFGVADRAHIDAFPADYADTLHVHLATAPPPQQLAWLRRIHQLSPRPAVSVDCFEQYARDHPATSRQVCEAADLVFMNEEEYEILGGEAWDLSVPLILKRGDLGASYRAAGHEFHVSTTPLAVIDTTGAGDMLAGTFLALRLGGLAPVEALREATRAATASVSEFGVDGPKLAAVLQAIRESAKASIADGG